MGESNASNGSDVTLNMSNQIATGNIEKAPQRLVDLANENGGMDNITVVIIKNI